MANYIEVELYGRAIRYYDETHVEMEFRNFSERWYKISVTATTKGYNTLVINMHGKNKYIQMHRLVFFIHHPSWNIYDSSKDNVIDHIDGNKANNKIENLQCVTNHENLMNIKKTKGYSLNKGRGKKWKASIRVNGKSIHLGNFDTEEEAHNAYLIGKAKYHIICPKSFP